MMKSSPQRDLSANLLRLRRLRGVTLPELAEASRVALGALSRIESGWGNPQLATLTAIAEALDVPVDELVRAWDPCVHVLRSSESKMHRRYGLATFSVGHITARGLDLELAFMRIGRPAQSMGGPGLVEHVLVVAGDVELDFEDDVVTLRPGDYLRFDADVPHQYRAVGTLARAVLLKERRG
jgi:mannose-6-phosphate isomerase-like protein (cupin superfamily)/DNA-binding XRE family transcriptional regulator